MNKRILCILLAMIMVVGLLPAAAFAAEGTHLQRYASRFNAVEINSSFYRAHQPKTYEVLVRGAVPESALKIMRRGMRLAEGEDLLPVDVTAQPAAGNTMLQMVLRQGFNRQIRRMCRDLGLTVLRLCRVAQGALHLGNLASGKVRALTDEEVTKLRESAGL